MLSPSDLRRPLPPQWKLHFAADTGTYMSALFVAFPPDSFDAFVLEEFPNYHYVSGGEIELLGGDVGSIPGWSSVVSSAWHRYLPHSDPHGWCDENSQFKTELANYGIHIQGNKRKLELRVEISREYVNNRRVWLAPWLRVLPWEMEHAEWPEDVSRAGRFEREKINDHTLDCFEHILSRRPRHRSMVKDKPKSFIQQHVEANRRLDIGIRADRHLGAN